MNLKTETHYTNEQLPVDQFLFKNGKILLVKARAL